MKLECPWLYTSEDQRWRCAYTFGDSDEYTPKAREELAAHLVYTHGVSPDFAARVASHMGLTPDEWAKERHRILSEDHE